MIGTLGILPLPGSLLHPGPEKWLSLLVDVKWFSLLDAVPFGEGIDNPKRFSSPPSSDAAMQASSIESNSP